jgi:hypothetical protein
LTPFLFAVSNSSLSIGNVYKDSIWIIWEWVMWIKSSKCFVRIEFSNMFLFISASREWIWRWGWLYRSKHPYAQFTEESRWICWSSQFTPGAKC